MMWFFSALYYWLIENGAAFAASALVTVIAVFTANRIFVETWFKSRLTRIEEKHKSDLTREVEQLKSTLSTNLDRATKAHTREFEAAADLWGAAVDAAASAGTLLSQLQRYPLDPVTMTASQRQTLFRAYDISDERSHEIMASANPHQLLMKEIDAERMQTAAVALDKFRATMFKSSIFLSDSLYREFHDYFVAVADAVREHDVYRGTSPRPTAARDAFLDNYLPRLEALRGAVYRQLWEHKLPPTQAGEVRPSEDSRPRGYLWWAMIWPKR